MLKTRALPISKPIFKFTYFINIPLTRSGLRPQNSNWLNLYCLCWACLAAREVVTVGGRVSSWTNIAGGGQRDTRGQSWLWRDTVTGWQDATRARRGLRGQGRGIAQVCRASSPWTPLIRPCCPHSPCSEALLAEKAVISEAERKHELMIWFLSM